MTHKAMFELRLEVTVGKHEGVMRSEIASVSLIVVRATDECRAMLNLPRRTGLELAISNCGDGVQAENERFAPFLSVNVLASRSGLRVDTALYVASRIASDY